MKVIFGTDSEWGIRNRKGRPVPAHLFFPGKDDKLEVPVKQRGLGYLFRDGYNLEINVPPSHCPSVIVDSVNVMLQEARKHMGSHYRLSPKPAYLIDLSGLKNAPYDVQQFGCEPVMDAYLEEERSVNLDGTTHPLRYCGSHFHFSIKPQNAMPRWMGSFQDVCLFTRMLDARIGVALSLLHKSPGMFARRKHYGLAGEFRLQRYSPTKQGIEYRVPTSEVWNDSSIAMLIMRLGRDTILQFKSLKKSWDRKREPLIKRAINTGIGLKEQLSTVPLFYEPEDITTLATWKEGGLKRFAFHKHMPVPEGVHCEFPGWGGLMHKMKARQRKEV